MTSDARTCPECHARIPTDAPPGVCPYCALRAGLRWDDATQADRAGGAGMPPTPEALALQLPELEAFELIGPGGMGTVYQARHRGLGRQVAVKVLHTHLQHDGAFAERFVREARTMARLDHPNIVRVYDCGHRGDIYYLVMEYVDGVTLRQAAAAKRFEPAEALAMVPRICEALQYAHDQGVVHRDIKPENILIDRSGAVKIADFGLAKLVGNGGGARLTRTAQVMGTPHYMAPEQIEHPAEVDHRADIYALGVVLYELLTGELPVGRFPPPSRKVAVDVRLDEVVLRTLEKEPRLRYQRVSDLSTEIRSLSAPDTAPVTRRARRHRRPVRVHRGGGGFEYRSRRTLWGLPLVHVRFLGDPSGARMALARGIIAVGDAAIGLIAVGGFAFGGVTISGMGVGLLSFGGIAAGLLLAMGGIAFGGLAVGGIGFGVVAGGRLPIGLVELSEAGRRALTLGAWAVGTLGVVAAIAGTLWLLREISADEDPRSAS